MDRPKSSKNTKEDDGVICTFDHCVHFQGGKKLISSEELVPTSGYKNQEEDVENK